MGSRPIAAEASARVSRAIPPGSTLCVGFSGGLDSTVLLDILAAHVATAGLQASRRCTCTTGCRPTPMSGCASASASAPTTACRSRSGACMSNPAAPGGVEAAARSARYAAFAARSEPYRRAGPSPRRPGRDRAAAAAARHRVEGNLRDAGAAPVARHGRAYLPAAAASTRAWSCSSTPGAGAALDRGRVQCLDAFRSQFPAPGDRAAASTNAFRDGASRSRASRATRRAPTSCWTTWHRSTACPRAPASRSRFIRICGGRAARERVARIPRAQCRARCRARRGSRRWRASSSRRATTRACASTTAGVAIVRHRGRGAHRARARPGDGRGPQRAVARRVASRARRRSRGRPRRDPFRRAYAARESPPTAARAGRWHFAPRGGGETHSPGHRPAARAR